MEDCVHKIDQSLLRDYIGYVRSNVNPVLSDPARAKLIQLYVKMRQSSVPGSISAYPRQLESMIRLAEAHAEMVNIFENWSFLGAERSRKSPKRTFDPNSRQKPTFQIQNSNINILFSKNHKPTQTSTSFHHPSKPTNYSPRPRHKTSD